MESSTTNDMLNFTQSHSRIVIKFQDNLCLPYQGAEEINNFFSQNHIIPWQHIVTLYPGITIGKLFTSLKSEKITEWLNKAKGSDTEYQPRNFLSYYVINCPPELNTEELLQMLLNYKSVELAYVEYGAIIPPTVEAIANPLSLYQGYLNPAPEGIDAKYAWNIDGGDGRGMVKFIDIEQGWMLNHEDIRINVLPDTGINHYAYEDHGTAVLGVIIMQDNKTGGVGITPRATGYVISQWRSNGSLNTADAIMTAIDHLDFGDIILLETQTLDSAKGSNVWPIEIHEANYQVIRFATALGIIVVEAGGNGNYNSVTGNDLDKFTDSMGKEIINCSSRDFKDSGSIVVAAATSSLPHTRIHYSNYGNRVDCYAWGENVVTAGYLPRSSGMAINTYTQKFSGTSSASAIIAGVAIAVQSIAESKFNYRLSPRQMRSILSNELYGTPSSNGHLIDKIGVMPDLKKIIDNAL